MSKDVKKVERKKYVLTKSHTHRGVDLQPGDEVELTASQAEFIKDKLADTTKAEGNAPAQPEG
jgi:hypothetical protein